MLRSANNPILTREHIPDVPPGLVDVTSVFNPGAIKVGDQYVLLLRVQTRGRRTVLMLATSHDGEAFTVEPRVLDIEGIGDVGEEVFHVYDPRLTMIDDVIYIVFAADVPGACRLGVAKTDASFEQLELVSFDSSQDSRNGVLFPEKRYGKFIRMERPNATTLDSGVKTGSEIIVAESDDLITWTPVGAVFGGRSHYWDELIGSGPPPVKTREGWLHVYHGVATHFASSNIYQAGVSLLDLNDPTKVIARGGDNILEPRELWEMVGQVPNVVFPSGMIVEEFDGEGFAKPDSLVRIYYGAADTVVGLVTTTVSELLAECQRR